MIFATTCHNNSNQSCISPLSGRTSRETRPLASVKHLLDEPLHRRYRRKLLSNPDTTSWHTLNSKTCKTSSEFREELENDGIACADKQSQQNPTKSIHTPHQPLPTTCASGLPKPHLLCGTDITSRCIKHFADHVVKGLPLRSQRTQMLHGTSLGQPWRRLNCRNENASKASKWMRKKKSCPMWYCVNTYGNSGLADSPKNH